MAYMGSNYVVVHHSATFAINDHSNGDYCSITCTGCDKNTKKNTCTS